MSLIGKTVEEQMWNFFMARVGNAYGVAALMAHWFAESGLNPKNLQNNFEKKLGYTDESYTKAVDNGSYTNFVHDSAGYGLAQWTYWSRKQNLLCFAQERGCSIGDTEMQFEFGYHELSTGYKAVLAVMKSAKSVREASDVLLTQYERPADQSEAVKVKRAGYGQKYYEKYAESALNGGNNMSVRIGHASISERGTINGAKGDQTGGEVCVRSWYSKPWDYVAIHPDAAVREKHAKAVEAACANNNIGYGQSDRNTLNTLAKAAGYDFSRVGKCNCDCSSLQNVAAVASGASGVTYGSNGWTTSTMKAALQKAGYRIITDSTYLSSAAYCVRGAIYVKASSHTVCGLDNGASYKKTLEKAGISTGTTSAPTASGSAGALIAKLQPAQSKDSKLAGAYKTTTGLNLRYGAGSDKYASIVIMPKGTKCQCYGYYTDVSGTKWLYIVATVNGKQYTGFASSKYLAK